MRELVASIRAVEFEYGRPIGILVDLQGPKLRVGSFAGGPVVLSNGATFILDADPERPVLVVYADSAFPGEYRDFAEGAHGDRALAVLLKAGAARTATIELGSAQGGPRSETAQPEAFLAHLADGAPGTWHGAQRTWSWH